MRPIAKRVPPRGPSGRGANAPGNRSRNPSPAARSGCVGTSESSVRATRHMRIVNSTRRPAGEHQREEDRSAHDRYQTPPNPGPCPAPPPRPVDLVRLRDHLGDGEDRDHAGGDRDPRQGAITHPDDARDRGIEPGPLPGSDDSGIDEVPQHASDEGMRRTFGQDEERHGNQKAACMPSAPALVPESARQRALDEERPSATGSQPTMDREQRPSHQSEPAGRVSGRCSVAHGTGDRRARARSRQDAWRRWQRSWQSCGILETAARRSTMRRRCSRLRRRTLDVIGPMPPAREAVESLRNRD